MIRTAAIGFAALVAAPACLAEGGPIRGGEHAGFSRIVMEIDPTTEWSLELAGGGVEIFFPGKALDFGTGVVFERIPRTRIATVESRIGPAGTTVAVAIGCDCRVSTAFVGARYLALDVSDRDAVRAEAAGEISPAAPEAPPASVGPEPQIEPEQEVESAEARALRERGAVGSAEEILIRQIERAAGQGLIELAAPGGGVAVAAPGQDEPVAEVAQAQGDQAPPAAPVPPPPPAQPKASPLPTVPLALDRSTLPEPAALVALLESDQVRATTVFDRDRAAVAREAAEAVPSVPSVCRPDTDFDVGRWADARPPYQQIAERGGRLLGEFDTPDPDVLLALVQLHVRFGLGTEAEQILAAFPVEIDARPLLVDLARAVEGRVPAPGGPLTVAEPCPGAHGLWIAIAGTAPAFHDASHFVGVAAAFGELPPDLRTLVGPALIGRLLDADEPEAARLIYDTTTRPEPGRSASLILGEARLVAAEGNPAAAVEALGDLVEANAPNAPEALAHLARLAIDAGLPLPDRLIADLGAAARQFHSADQGPAFLALLAEALAARGQIADAAAEVRVGIADWPQDARFPALGLALLAAADPARDGAAAYAETILASQSLVPETAYEARLGIARHLLDLGLAGVARDFVAPAAGRGDPVARLLDAEAALAMGSTETARAVLAGLEGPAAAALRARSFARDGAFDAAVATLVEAGLDPEAGAYAWPSGDWPRARAAAGEDPDRLALARYMEARADPAGVSAPSPGATAPTGPAALAEPLPRLETPTLEAARSLLASGREVEDFVAGLLRAP